MIFVIGIKWWNSMHAWILCACLPICRFLAAPNLASWHIPSDRHIVSCVHGPTTILLQITNHMEVLDIFPAGMRRCEFKSKIQHWPNMAIQCRNDCHKKSIPQCSCMEYVSDFSILFCLFGINGWWCHATQCIQMPPLSANMPKIQSARIYAESDVFAHWQDTS